MARKTWILVLLGLALAAFVAHSSNQARFMSAAAETLPQTTLTGEWKAWLAKDGPKDGSKSWLGKDGADIHINFERGTSKDDNHSTGHGFTFAELGLTREQVQQGGPVTFRLVREAGTIECTGSFQNGKGSGTFNFTANPTFSAAMKSRGFDFEKDANRHEGRDPEFRLFEAAVLNVTTALADDLLSANFGKLEVSDLFKAAIFRIDSAFMREMKATGFPNLSFNDLVKARIFHINADFVRQAAQMGFGKEGFESLVKMSIFKVTPEFVAEVRSAGLTDISVKDVVKLRIFHIDGDLIRKAKTEGVPMDVEQLVKWKLGAQRSARRSVVI